MLYFHCYLKDTTSTSTEKTTMLTSAQTAVSINQTTSRPHTLPTNSIKITPIMTSSTLSTMTPTTDQTGKNTQEIAIKETTLLASSPLTTIIRSTDQTITEHPLISGK